MSPSNGPTLSQLNPEKVAYWYLRLNGFLQIEDFYVHPSGRGGTRTDADLLAVRFPHRAERLYDDPTDIMQDDSEGLALSSDQIDVVIAEVKAGRCALNGPWTDPDKKNVHRVLAAVGCIPHDRINHAADEIYRTGVHEGGDGLRIRLVAIGREASDEVGSAYPYVQQVIWRDLLSFIFHRHQKFRSQKRQTDHWDPTGRQLKTMATDGRITCETFVRRVQAAMEKHGGGV